MHPRNVGALLNSSIDPLMPQARRLLELQRLLNEALPANLARSCSIANLKQGKVVIFAENSAVAAKLRLIAPGLKDRLSRSGNEVTGIEVEVQLRSNRQARKTDNRRLSPAAARDLAELAEQLPDSSLKTAISSLAKHVSER